MKIAVDARELAGRPTGVGRYLAELFAAWQEDPEAQRHTWQLYAHAPVAHHLPANASISILPGDGGTRWEQWTLSRALAANRPDVLFAPGYTAPLTAPCPVALTIHDVSYMARPEWFSWREGVRRRTLTRWSARRARVVITDSIFSRGEIARHVGIPPTTIRVIPLGIRTASAPAATVNARARAPVVLFVGSIFRRRHVDRLLSAFTNIVAPALPESRLEIVGENRLFPPGDVSSAVRGAPPDVARRVRFRLYVDDATLATLYGEAAAFVFLSEYEGFGLTPLEALTRGIPPIVLDTSVAREVYGPAARYVSELSDAAVGDAILAMLTRDDARDQVLRHREAVLARYSWSRAAEATLAAIREAAGV